MCQFRIQIVQCCSSHLYYIFNQIITNFNKKYTLFTKGNIKYFAIYASKIPFLLYFKSMTSFYGIAKIPNVFYWKVFPIKTTNYFIAIAIHSSIERFNYVLYEQQKKKWNKKVCRFDFVANLSLFNDLYCK